MIQQLIPETQSAVTQVMPVFNKRLQKKLQSILPRASEPALQRFITCYLKTEIPERSLALELFDEKCGSNEILLVLIYCRNLMLTVNERASAEEDGEYLKRLLLHHDRLTVWLMQALEEKRDAEWKALQAQLLQEEYHHRLTRACHEWSKEKELKVYNYYKEMPVSTALKLLKVGASSFTVRRNDDLTAVILASNKGCRLFTDMPGCDLCMELKVVEATRDTVHLHYGEFSLVEKQRRRETRVLCNASVQATLRNSEFQTWECDVCDLSASGLGLIFKQEMELHKGDAFVFTLWLHGEKIMGRGVTAWVRNGGGLCHAGLSIEYNKVSYNFLNLEVKRRIKISLVELQLRGEPSCLR